MTTTTSDLFDFPVGNAPNWESGEALVSIPDSHVIEQSLAQSRRRWMNNAFPKFSSRGRSKNPDPTLPPHNIQLRGWCHLQIGPHFFYETSISEVQYSSPQPTQTQTQPSTSSNSNPVLSGSSVDSTSTPPSAHTMDLLDRLSSAASADPQLRHLIQLCTSNKLDLEQTKQINAKIQSLGDPKPPLQPECKNAGSESGMAVVLDFRDSPHARWMLPQEPTTLKVIRDSLGYVDIELAIQFPFRGSPASLENPPGSPKRVTKLHLLQTSPYVLDTLQRWIGDSRQMEENKKSLDKILETFPRQYLAHKLPTGSLLTQLQNVQEPMCPMKSLKPTGSSRSRKKSAPQAAVTPRASSIYTPQTTLLDGVEQCSRCGKTIPLGTHGFCHLCSQSTVFSAPAPTQSQSPVYKLKASQPVPTSEGVLQLAPRG